MIIFRGFGFLAFLMVGVGVGIGFLITAATGGDTRGTMNMTFVGTGWILAGIGTYFLGQYLNQTRPQQQADKLIAVKRQEFAYLIAAERFHAGPEYPFPRSKQEAQQQAEQVLVHLNAVMQQNKNVHTFFFIPMQWFGVLMAIGGLVALVSGFFG